MDWRKDVQQTQLIMDAILEQFDSRSDKMDEAIRNFKCDICGCTKAIRKGFRYACSVGRQGYFGRYSPLAQTHGEIFEISLSVIKN